jgi:hypothetical protein
VKRLAALVLAAVLVGGAAGCQSLALTDWSSPGRAPDQQIRAQQYDPYPENEPSPEILGARPREYDHPPAEVDKSRRLLRSIGAAY